MFINIGHESAHKKLKLYPKIFLEKNYLYDFYMWLLKNYKLKKKIPDTKTYDASKAKL